MLNMTKLTLTGTAMALVSALVMHGHVSAQTPALPTVDQVLSKYVTAVGGAAAIEKITTRTATGTIELPDMGINGAIQIVEKAPNKSFATVELGPVGTIREGTDGVTAWDENPGIGLREKTGEELTESLRGATFNQEIKLKSMYKTLEVTGQESVGGRAAIAVLATPESGSATRMFFDVETGLMVKQSTTRQSPQGPVDLDVYMENYREVDGVKQPFLIRQVTAQATILIRITELKHNGPVDDAIFRKPGVPRP